MRRLVVLDGDSIVADRLLLQSVEISRR